MESFIKELYFGNLDPQEVNSEMRCKYTKAMSAISESEELLTN